MQIHGVPALLFAVLMSSVLVVQVRCRDPCCDIIDFVQEFIDTYMQKPLEQALSDALDLDIEIKKCDLEIASEFENILKNIIEMVNGASEFRPKRRIMVQGIRNIEVAKERKKRKANKGLRRMNTKVMKATLYCYSHPPDILTLKDMGKMRKAQSTTRKYLKKIKNRDDLTDLYKSTQDVLTSLNQAVNGNKKASKALKKLTKKMGDIATNETTTTVPPTTTERNEDVDECKGRHGCAHLCVNTLGSYKCRCHEGFFLNSDGRTCEVEDCLWNRPSCLDEMRCPPGYHCVDQPMEPPNNVVCCRKKEFEDLALPARRKRAIYCPPQVEKRQAGCPAACGPQGTRVILGPTFSFCRCNLMWEGQCCDVPQQHANMVSCRAWGDVHMDSFDKQNIHFQDSCITDMVTTMGTAFPSFIVSLKGYFKPGNPTYSWIEYLRVVVTGGATTTTIVIKKQDAAGHFVEWTGAGAGANPRITAFPHTQDVTYLLGPNPFTVRFMIYISGAYAVVDAASTLGLIMKSTATSSPRAYIYAANAWMNPAGINSFWLNGMCGDFDGDKALKDDLRGRNGAIVIPGGLNYGTAMSNSWRANDDPTCINTKADGPWNIGRKKRQANTDLIALAKLYCRNAHCDKEEGTIKWRSCSVDVSSPMPEDDMCLLLEEGIHDQSRCRFSEFDCPKVIRDAKKEHQSG